MKLLNLLLFTVFLAGCGGGPESTDRYFTSGNREADQRADQRMAKAEQLHDTGAGLNILGGTQHSLYERLGGEKQIIAIVDDFLPRALNDPRVNWERQGVTRGGLSIHRGKPVTWVPTTQGVSDLKTHLVQFLSLATGGPADYHGRQLQTVHANMHITNAEFDAAIGDLKATLDKLQISNTEQKELLSIIESTRTQIVEER